MQTFICPLCSREFHSSGKRTYCSRTCSNRRPHRITDAGKARIRAAKLGDKNPAKRPEVGRKISERLTGLHQGPAHPRFKGEWFVTHAGVTRAHVWIPDTLKERLGVKKNHTPRARYVWLMAHPGETLTRRDIIHHLNGNALDDRPENLERLENQSRHAKKHEVYLLEAAKRRKQPPKNCEQCGTLIEPWRRFCSTACYHTFCRGPRHANYRRQIDDAERQRLSAISKGRKWTPEQREHTLESRMKYHARIKAARPIEIAQCPQCGGPFQQPDQVTRKRQYCSKLCADRAKLALLGATEARSVTRTGTCRQCGQDYTYTTTANRPRRYCSPACIHAMDAAKAKAKSGR